MCTKRIKNVRTRVDLHDHDYDSAAKLSINTLSSSTDNYALILLFPTDSLFSVLPDYFSRERDLIFVSYYVCACLCLLLCFLARTATSVPPVQVFDISCKWHRMP